VLLSQSWLHSYIFSPVCSFKGWSCPSKLPVCDLCFIVKQIMSFIHVWKQPQRDWWLQIETTSAWCSCHEMEMFLQADAGFEEKEFSSLNALHLVKVKPCYASPKVIFTSFKRFLTSMMYLFELNQFDKSISYNTSFLWSTLKNFPKKPSLAYWVGKYPTGKLRASALPKQLSLHLEVVRVISQNLL